MIGGRCRKSMVEGNLKSCTCITFLGPDVIYCTAAKGATLRKLLKSPGEPRRSSQTILLRNNIRSSAYYSWRYSATDGSHAPIYKYYDNSSPSSRYNPFPILVMDNGLGARLTLSLGNKPRSQATDKSDTNDMPPSLLQSSIISPDRPGIHGWSHKRDQSHQSCILLVPIEHERANGETKRKISSAHGLDESENGLILRSSWDAKSLGATDRVYNGSQSDSGKEGGNKVAAGSFDSIGVYIGGHCCCFLSIVLMYHRNCIGAKS